MKKFFLVFLLIFLLTGCNNFEKRVKMVCKEASLSVVKIEVEVIDVDINGVKTSLFYMGSGVIYKTFTYIDNVKSEVNKYNNCNSFSYNVVTNKHVINNASSIKVITNDDKEYLGYLQGTDDKLDLAVISFNSDIYYQKAYFCNNIPDVGSVVIAIGSPNGLFNTATMGIISYSSRYIMDDTNDDGKDDFTSLFIQSDVAINPGNSGGGLFNLDGKLVGINTMKIVDENIEGIGFAIPSCEFLKVIDYLEEGVFPKRLILGISFDGIKTKELSKERIIITNIKQNGIGYKMGLRVNDIILKINGHNIDYLFQLFYEVNNVFISNTTNLEIIVLRDEKEMTFNAVV